VYLSLTSLIHRQGSARNEWPSGGTAANKPLRACTIRKSQLRTSSTHRGTQSRRHQPRRFTGPAYGRGEVWVSFLAQTLRAFSDTVSIQPLPSGHTLWMNQCGKCSRYDPCESKRSTTTAAAHRPPLPLACHTTASFMEEKHGALSVGAGTSSLGQAPPLSRYHAKRRQAALGYVTDHNAAECEG